MNNVYSGKKLIVFIQGRNDQCFFMEEMNSAYSGKESIKIVIIQGRTEQCLFSEEINSAHEGKK